MLNREKAIRKAKKEADKEVRLICREWRRKNSILNPFKKPSLEYIQSELFRPTEGTVYLRCPWHPNIG